MAREDLHFRLRISESLKKRIETASAANSRSMTAEIVARLEASFLADDMGEADEELIGILSEIDSLKSRLIRALKRG